MYFQTGSYFSAWQIWMQVTIGKNCGVSSGLGFGGWETEHEWSFLLGKGGVKDLALFPATALWIQTGFIEFAHRCPWVSVSLPEWGDSGLCHTLYTPPILGLAGGRFNPWCNSEQPQGCSGLCCFLTVPLGLPYLGMCLTCHGRGEAGGKGDRSHCIELPTDIHTLKSSWKLFHFRHQLENASTDKTERKAYGEVSMVGPILVF